METEAIITLVSAVAGSASLTTIFQYFINRRKQKVDVNVSERTENAQVGLVSVQELEAKLGFLNRVIHVLEQHNVRLQGEVDYQWEQNVQLNQRVRELANRCDLLESIVRKLCIENELDVEKLLPR